MVTFGQGEDAGPWVEVSSPADVTKFVLFPAASYGQFKTLKKFISNGEFIEMRWLPTESTLYTVIVIVLIKWQTSVN